MNKLPFLDRLKYLTPPRRQNNDHLKSKEPDSKQGEVDDDLRNPQKNGNAAANRISVQLGDSSSPNCCIPTIAYLW